MNIVISTKSEKPIYEQVYEQIASEILSGAICEGFLLPSIRGISRELGISVITVKKAYELLEQGGFIDTMAGKGSFVRRPHGGIADKKYKVASDRLDKDLTYYKNLGITEDELISLIREKYTKHS